MGVWAGARACVRAYGRGQGWECVGVGLVGKSVRAGVRAAVYTCGRGLRVGVRACGRGQGRSKEGRSVAGEEGAGGGAHWG